MDHNDTPQSTPESSGRSDTECTATARLGGVSDNGVEEHSDVPLALDANGGLKSKEVALTRRGHIGEETSIGRPSNLQGCAGETFKGALFFSPGVMMMMMSHYKISPLVTSQEADV